MPTHTTTPVPPKTQLTQAGYEEILLELKELEEVKLPTNIKRVELARQNGDLSENSEYHSAREDQELLETRITELKEVISNSTIVQNTKKHSQVGMGSQVTVKVKAGRSTRKLVLHICGEFEADPKAGKISSVSPLGKSLIDKKKGDTFELETPAGMSTYEILEIK